MLETVCHVDSTLCLIGVIWRTIGKDNHDFTTLSGRRYYLNRFDRLVHVPILYQEALVTGITDSESYRETVSKYQIDSDVTQRYSRFLEALDKSGGNVGELGEYKGTYWYYLVSNRLSSNNN